MSETVYELIGGHSYYQYFIVSLIFVFQFNTGINIPLPVFINYYQDFFCITPRNQTDDILNQHRSQFKGVDNATGYLVIDSSKCHYKRVSNICSEVILKGYPMTSTIRSQYHLYCEYHGLSSLAVLLYMTGICIGSLTGGLFSDRFGRIAGCFLGYFSMSISTTIAAFSPWYWLHVVARLVSGFGCSVSFVSNTAMLLEAVELKQRTTFGFIWSIGYDFGYIILVLLAYFIRSHYVLQIVISGISFISLIFPFLYKESFRWLLATNRYKKAKEVLLFIAKFNKKKTTEGEIDKYIETYHEERSKTAINTVSITEIFKYKVVTLNLFIVWFIFLSCSFCYYAFLLSSSKISEHIFVTTSITAFSCVFIRSTYAVLCRVLGRIKILLSLQISVTLLLITGMILKHFLGAKNMITAVLITFSIALSSTNFGYMWIYGGEAFPTVIRSTSVSIGSACGRISGMVASQMEWVFEISPNALPILGAIMAIVGSLSTFFILPETFHRPSLDFLSQAEKYFVEWRQPWRNKSKNKLEIEIAESSKL